MAEPTDSPKPTNVQEVFNGAQDIQNATSGCQAQIRAFVLASHGELMQSMGHGVHVEITTSIRIKTFDASNRQYNYHLAVDNAPRLDKEPVPNEHQVQDDCLHNGDGREIAAEARKADAHAEDEKSRHPVHVRTNDSTSSLKARASSPGRPLHATKTPIVAIPPGILSSRKRKRMDDSSTNPIVGAPPAIFSARTGLQTEQTDLANIQEPSNDRRSSEASADASPEDIMLFLQDWRKQWHSQGSWIYDQLTKMMLEEQRHHFSLHEKFSVLQGPAVHAIMSELANLKTTMFPWLEDCRKAAAAASQAREEKWRTSAATFHDNARRERETAERTILEELGEQKAMLKKLLKLQGLANHSQETLKEG